MYDMQEAMVPMAKQFKYLGIVAVYTDFEMLQAKHRLKAAGLARQRLDKVLHSSKYVSVRQQLLLYQACVRSTLM